MIMLCTYIEPLLLHHISQVLLLVKYLSLFPPHQDTIVCQEPRKTTPKTIGPTSAKFTCFVCNEPYIRTKLTYVTDTWVTKILPHFLHFSSTSSNFLCFDFHKI